MLNSRQVVAVIQARTASTRLPGKILKRVNGLTLLQIIVSRLKRSRYIDQIILATTSSQSDDMLCKHAEQTEVEYIRGDENDLMSRIAQAAKITNAEIIVRVTGDCPLIEPEIVDKCLGEFEASSADYASNVQPPTYPDGLDVEVFSYGALERCIRLTTGGLGDRHPTKLMTQSAAFQKTNIESQVDNSHIRVTVDEPEDLLLIEEISSAFNGLLDVTYEQLVELFSSRPELLDINSMFSRNEGEAISDGQKLWKRAKKVIPGGNMLLSKNPDRFLPSHWPSYYSRAKGCTIWDLEGKSHIDMSIMGVGTNILGYSHPKVDAAVTETVRNGNMCTLNCPEEVYLAERLVELHKWSDMVRFARTGGEANALAIRIARAATGRDTIAVCGYHGWHDWYLATNLANQKGLEEYVMPGLNPAGVPASLAGTTIPFSYNRVDQIKDIFDHHNLAAVKMEVQRSTPPAAGFLETIRELCSKNGTVLIFDECTSGFRETHGGLHKKYGVNPDIAMFGKALGNGYAITAVVGKEEVMEACQNTFVSSTFWTERIGPTAALATLDVMEQEASWQLITQKGIYIRENWKAIAHKHKLEIEINGLPSLSVFNFTSEKSLAYRTLITQEMLKKGFLANTSCYVSIAHTDEILSEYFEALDETFALIKRSEDGEPIETLLEGPICVTGFTRLN